MFAQPILGTRLSALGAAGKAEAFAEARASLSPSLSAIEDSIAQQGPLLERIKVCTLHVVSQDVGSHVKPLYD